MPHRPLKFDDLIKDQQAFIGPPSPPQIPKFTAKADREEVYRMMLNDLAEKIAVETEQWRRNEEKDASASTD